MHASQFVIIVLSALLHAIWNFFAKRAPQKLEIITLGLGTCTLVFLPGLYFETARPSLLGIGIAMVSGLIQAAYVALLYRSYSFSNLTLVYPLSRGTGVIGTFCLETLLTAHPWSALRMVGIVTITLGTSGLAFPHLKGAQRQGVIGSILVGLILSIAYLIGRSSVAHIPPFTYLWTMYATSFLFLLFFLKGDRVSNLREAYRSYGRVAAIMGIGSFLSYLLVVYLFRTTPAALVVAVRELSVVFGAILGFVFLREKVTLLKVVTILAIVAGAMLLKIT